MIRYRGEIGIPHPLHFPLSQIQPKIGIFSIGPSLCPHFGQEDGGQTMEIPRGIRHTHAVVKLPKHPPRINAYTYHSTTAGAPYSCSQSRMAPFSEESIPNPPFQEKKDLCMETRRGRKNTVFLTSRKLPVPRGSFRTSSRACRTGSGQISHLSPGRKSFRSCLFHPSWSRRW